MSRYSAINRLNGALKLVQKGNHHEALKKLKQAENIANIAKADDICLYVRTRKGQLMQTLGKYEEALKIHSFVLKATEELISKTITINFINQFFS